MRVIPTIAESNRRIRMLRARGYQVKRLRLPDGTIVVLKSRRPFVCSPHHHCSEPAPKKRRRRAVRR